MKARQSWYPGMHSPPLAREQSGFTLAGTVYGGGGSASRQANDRFGLPNAIVRITDAEGRVVEMTCNAVRVLYTESPVALPYTASIVVDGKESKMLTPQTSSDSACLGAAALLGAPGQITEEKPLASPVPVRRSTSGRRGPSRRASREDEPLRADHCCSLLATTYRNCSKSQRHPFGNCNGV